MPAMLFKPLCGDHHQQQQGMFLSMMLDTALSLSRVGSKIAVSRKIVPWKAFILMALYEGKTTITSGFSSQNANNMALWHFHRFFSLVKQTVKLLVIWDALIMKTFL